MDAEDADLDDVDFTSASAPLDEHENPADLAETSVSAVSADARSITGTSEAELDDLGSAGIAALEARLRLSPRLGAGAFPVCAQPPATAPSFLEQMLASRDSKIHELQEKLDKDYRFVQQDAEANARRATLLEETLALKDEKIAELQSKVDGLREKKRELVRKAELEHVNTTQEVRDQVNAEIRRFQEKAQADIEAVRSSLAALHQKEVSMLQERVNIAEERCLGLQSRLDNEEQAHQALQLSASRDAEANARRATLLEETLALKDEKIAELQSKVDGLREKKRELVRKAELEHVNTTQEVRDQVNAEIRRFQEKAQADIEAVRSSLTALHQKEVSMLQERVNIAEERCLGLQSRLDNEEQAHQALQLSASRVRAELQNEITELTGSLKLRVFEIERASLTHEEVSSARQKLDAENEALKKQVDTLRKEFYNLELQYKEGRASERAELASLREQMKGYLALERDLDAAIAGCADAPLASSVDAQEALLIGTTLGSAPASAQRRIQQSLLLAQELQRRSRELRQQTAASEEAQKEISRLKQELDMAQLQARATGSSEPQAYLQNSLRECQAEVSRVKLELKSCKQDLLLAQQRAEGAQRARLQVEEDMRKLLSSRDFLQQLKQEMDSLKQTSAVPLKQQLPASVVK